MELSKIMQITQLVNKFVLFVRENVILKIITY